jgi:alkenylglycerophosphocholine/alkenylglycerophosphoethanolamine hydrolase
MSTSQQGATSPSRISARALLVIGLIGAVVYIIGQWMDFPQDGMLELITKGIPVLCLIVWLWGMPRDRFSNLILAGLIVSLAADLVLQWDRALFVWGLLLFLIAQLIYIAAFLGVTRRGSWVRLLPFVAWGLTAFLILSPDLGEMLLPVAVYIIAIVAMMWRAAALPGAQGQSSRDFEWAALLGAIAFGLSDTLLAFNRFVWHDTLTFFNLYQATPFVSTLVIILYWLAQWCIALAASWEAKDRARAVVTGNA